MRITEHIKERVYHYANDKGINIPKLVKEFTNGRTEKPTELTMIEGKNIIKYLKEL